MPITLKQLASSLAADSASAILHAGLDAPAQSVVSVVVIEDADLCVELIVRRCEKKPVADAIILPHGLSKLQHEIMSILDMHTHKKGSQIASKLKRGNDGNLRTALAGLVKSGLLEKGPDGNGYRLASA